MGHWRDPVYIPATKSMGAKFLQDLVLINLFILELDGSNFYDLEYRWRFGNSSSFLWIAQPNFWLGGIRD